MNNLFPIKTGANIERMSSLYLFAYLLLIYLLIYYLFIC